MTPEEIRFDSAGNVIPEGYDILPKDRYYNISGANEDTQIGSPVTVFSMEGYIRSITFTNTKVRFSVRIFPENTTIHNIDSFFVAGRPGDRLDMGEDNYS